MFKILASFTDRNGVRVSCNTDSAIGPETRRARFVSRELAEYTANELQSNLADYPTLSASTVYSVEEVSQ